MKFRNILQNSQLRLLLTGSFFTAAFIWMGMTSYGVSEEEIKVFLIFSFMCLGILIVAGLLFSVVVRLFRRDKEGLLAKIDALEQEVAAAETTSKAE